MFEQNLSRNLYKLWNRMSSRSYFSPPVKQVEIPKAIATRPRLPVQHLLRNILLPCLRLQPFASQRCEGLMQGIENPCRTDDLCQVVPVQVGLQVRLHMR
jgi:hypothetical protein